MRDLWLFSQTATRRLRRELRVWTLRATFSRKIMNFSDPQSQISLSFIQRARCRGSWIAVAVSMLHSPHSYILFVK
jgi:hypothetical protein